MRIISICIICCAFMQPLFAQSLPNIQTQSLRLPDETKIDGKLSEWPGSLQAYNKATRLEYTLANDDKRLYLAIRSKDKSTTSKILIGGISFTLKTSDKDDTDKGVSIIFPATNSAYTYTKEGRRTANFKNLSDSTDILTSIQQLREIKVLRFKRVQDSILSIYNNYGISSKLAYTNETLICELTIPLDLIGISVKKSFFNYNIRLNGVPLPARPLGDDRLPEPFITSRGGVSEMELIYVTDFDGKYTTAIK